MEYDLTARQKEILEKVSHIAVCYLDNGGEGQIWT